MRSISGIVFVLCIFLAACNEATDPAVQPQPSANCAELDSLFLTLNALDSVLMNDEPWETCLPYLDASLPALTRNQRPDNKDCNYLDQRYKPDILRLGFVESLRSRIETDTLSQGIYYMLRWMGIFKGDPEISEFFSEEISYVAMENPTCYLGYLQHNPDQEVMLLHSTKWNAPDLDSLLNRFARLPGSETVTAFLSNLKDQKTDGI
ncbi:MAG: hypothetical protein U0176_01490 [Bacteroidia bacterium]